MENSKVKTSGITAVLLGVALAATAIVGAYQYQEVQETKKELTISEGHSNELVLKKGELEQRVSSLSSELETKIKEAEAFEARLKEMEAAESKDKNAAYKSSQRYASLLKEQTSRKQQIDSLQSQLATLNGIKDEMAEQLKQIPVLEEENTTLKTTIATWEEKFATLEQEFKALESKYQQVIYDAPADNFRVEVLAKNGKLTSKAKKAHRVTVSFLMPAFLQREMKGQETLYLSLFDEKVKPLAGYKEELRINSNAGDIPIAIHDTEVFNAENGPQTVNFEATLAEPLEPGFYKGKVYSKQSYFGTIDFRLR